ncbi:hypothetical protein HPB52_004413 [Rhipicephalus sanguineus]|uniref:Uncharacterized protein n=2 Tax=Rhipicephalus sanguineus TaxID=34632 RepID=A0A9D4PQA3_RHISA|nr:hypothetical protein HPB52_004413 [Rhipicephalus sanguineus]
MGSNEGPSDDQSLISGQEEPLPGVGESKRSDADNDQPARQDDDIGAAGEPGASPSTSADTHDLEVAGVSTSTWWDPSTVDDSMQVPNYDHDVTTSSVPHLYQESHDFRNSRGSRIPRLTPGDIEERPRRSAAERMRSVEASLTEAREVLYELLREIMAEAQEATGVSSLDGIVIEDELPGPPLSQSTSTGDANSNVLQFEIVGDLRSAVDPILDSLEELEDESLDPRGDARHYIIGDELCALYDQMEARWEETIDHICEDMNCRYTQYVADCRESLQKADVDESVRKQLRRDMAEARSLLIAMLRDDFRNACEAFTDWRTLYLQRELHLSYMSLTEGDRFSLLASVLRYEVLECLPDLEKRTEERAAELWKALVEYHWRDVDGIFDEAK